MKELNYYSGGIGLFGATFIALLVLKLTGYITCSWWIVTLPLWVGFAFIAAVILVPLVICGVVIAFYALFKLIASILSCRCDRPL